MEIDKIIEETLEKEAEGVQLSSCKSEQMLDYIFKKGANKKMSLFNRLIAKIKRGFNLAEIVEVAAVILIITIIPVIISSRKQVEPNIAAANQNTTPNTTQASQNTTEVNKNTTPGTATPNQNTTPNTNPVNQNPVPNAEQVDQKPAPVLENKKLTGLITRIYEQNGKKFMEIDEFKFLTGAEAVKAAKKDGKQVYDDYYIVNESNVKSTYEISSKLSIRLCGYLWDEQNGGIELRPATYAQLKSFVEKKQIRVYYAYVENGKVVKIEQQFTP